MSDAAKSPGRRVVLRTLGGLALSGLCVACGEAAASSGPVSAGPVSQVPVGSLEFVPGGSVLLGRDAGGLYAMTSICTHEGCDISQEGEIQGAVIICHCHGARFDSAGSVLQGPARSPLRHFLVEVDASGEITIQQDTEVAADVRLAV